MNKYCTMASWLVKLRAAIVGESQHFTNEWFKMFSIQRNRDAGGFSVKVFKLCLSLKNIIASQILDNISVMYQSVPSVTIPSGNPQANFQKASNPDPLGKFFVSNPRGAGFPGTFNFNKFYTFSPYSRPQSIFYPLNIYKFIERTEIYEWRM